MVWFYATCIELHGIQLFFAAALTAWVVRVLLDEGKVVSAPVTALLAAGPAGAHMTGILLLPAVAAFLYGTRKRVRSWRRGAALFIAFAALWFWGSASRAAAPRHVQFGLRSLLEAPDFELFRREILAPQGTLFVAGMLCAVVLYLRRRRLDTATLCCTLVYLAFLPFAASVDIAERGAYFVCLVPVSLALVAAFWRRLPPVADALLVVLIALNTRASLTRVSAWRNDFPQASWARQLIAEAEGRGVVMTYDMEEFWAVHRHSRMRAFCLFEDVELEAPATRRYAEQLIRQALEDGGDVYATRRFLNEPNHGVPAFLDLLEDWLGAPEWKAGGEYARLERAN